MSINVIVILGQVPKLVSLYLKEFGMQFNNYSFCL